MAKTRLTWSIEAKKDRREILDYWRRRNKSNFYTRRLSDLFRRAVRLIQHYPEIGILDNKTRFRRKLVENYFIVYETLPSEIRVLRIWSTKRNPKDLSIIE